LLALWAPAATLKRDPSGLGKFLFVGVLLLTSFANIFFQIPAPARTISAVAVRRGLLAASGKRD